MAGVGDVSPTIYGVFGTGPNSVWAVSAIGQVLLWTGQQWMFYRGDANQGSPDTAELHGIWVPSYSLDATWIAGNGGKIFRRRVLPTE